MLPGEPNLDTESKALQAAWEGELTAAGFDSVDSALKKRDYVASEFPPTIEFDEATDEFVVWENGEFLSENRTMEEIREAMAVEGLIPASPAHAPAYARRKDSENLWIPYYSKSPEGPAGSHFIAAVHKFKGKPRGEDEFRTILQLGLHWRDQEWRWSGGEKFLAIRRSGKRVVKDSEPSVPGGSPEQMRALCMDVLAERYDASRVADLFKDMKEDETMSGRVEATVRIFKGDTDLALQGQKGGLGYYQRADTDGLSGEETARELEEIQTLAAQFEQEY